MGTICVVSISSISEADTLADHSSLIVSEASPNISTL